MDSLLHTENSEVPDKSGRETAVDLKSNETYGIHGEPRDTPTDYENPFGECSPSQQSVEVAIDLCMIFTNGFTVCERV